MQENSDRIYEKKEILKDELLELQDAHDRSVKDYKLEPSVNQLINSFSQYYYMENI